MIKVMRLACGLIGLALAAGCLGGPAPALRGVSWVAGGRATNAVSQPDAPPAPTGVIPAPTSVPPTVAPATATPLPAMASAAPSRPAPTLSPVEAALPVASPAPLPAPTTRLPILEYHYSTFEMLPTVMMRPAWFEAQLQWLAEAGYHSVSSAELAAFVSGQAVAPAHSVALTFDVSASHFDEYSRQIIPALRRHHLRAIFFVMPSQTRDACDGRIACWPSLLAWRDEGLISIESHSFTHQDYATLSPDMLAFDLARSKAGIEAKTGQPVLGLCYPFDSVVPAAFDLLKAAGYRYAVAGATRHDRSAQWSDPQPYALPRYYPYSSDALYPVIGGTGGLTFEQMLLGAVETKAAAGN